MNTLDAVNLCLRKLGESEVTSIDEPYPTLGVIVPALTDNRVKLLTEGRGWWFNSYDVALNPDTEGAVAVPESILMFYPDSTDYVYAGTSIVQTGSLDAVIKSPVDGRAILDVEFDRLPRVARYTIAYATAHEVYVNDFGPDQTSQAIQAEWAGWYALLSAANTRQSKLNIRQKPHVARWYQNLRN